MLVARLCVYHTVANISFNTLEVHPLAKKSVACKTRLVISSTTLPYIRPMCISYSTIASDVFSLCLKLI